MEDVDKKAFNPPMLAQKYEGNYTEDIKFIQPKLDGIRCNMSFKNNEVIALSRKNNPFYTVEHIKSEIYDILRKNPSLHLDGELYNHELHDDFNKVVSLVKKEKLDDNKLEEVIKYVRYNIYDLWDDNNPNLIFSERYNLIINLFKDCEYVNIVDTNLVSNVDDIEKYFKLYTSNGYEGAILRKDEVYEHKRSKNLLKYKEFMDDEFLIIDICDGKTKNGIAEYAHIRLKDDTTCKATLSFTDEECAEIYQNRNYYIGKMATIRFFGYTNDGKLRFPVLKVIRDYE